ncbi:MAG: phosphoribosylanthranilate isomerase [Thermaerobacter sp.]|nr:phosphoribosylanthranilate isomerase [Thermaerobacter sp.]
MWIKICGIRDLAAAGAAAELAVDAVGFVFAESPRRVSARRARELGALLPPGILRVGVFRGASQEEVRRTAERAGLNAVQLHDPWEEAAVAKLREEGWRVIRALILAPGGAPPPVPEQADYLLADSRSPGSGQRADWTAAGRLAAGAVPLILAGGLTPDNLGAALAAVAPFGVDVSSGVERGGRKDPELMRRFVAAARGRGQ